MDHIKKMYSKAFLEHGDSPNAVLWPKGRQHLRFDALCRFIEKKSGFSVLDFGCGLAHMKEYLDEKYGNVNYTGADMLPEFVDANQKKFPESNFVLANDVNEIKGNFDFIFVSGTFNILYEKDFSKHQATVFEMMKILFEKSNVFFSANFMSNAVDFKQPDTYHQDVSEMYNFVSKELSKRIVIDQSYMPYEYTMTVWKDQSIIRPDNIFPYAG